MRRLLRVVGVVGVVIGMVVASPLSASAGVLDVRFSPVSIVEGTGVDNELADFDGDGILDIVGGRYEGIGVLLGTGNGEFAPVTVYRGGAGRSSFVAVDDIDGDGSPDVVAFHRVDLSDSDAPSQLQVYVNDGAGVLRPGPLTTVETSRVNTKVVPLTGDFDGDGQIDVALAGDPGVVAFGDGTGRFPQLEYPALPVLFAAGDIDSDGIDDLIGGVVELVIVTLTGNGDGTFTRRDLPFDDGGSFPDGPEFADLADLDEDGDLDIVATSTKYLRHLLVFLGAGDGTFSLPTAFRSRAEFNDEPEIGDVNGDGDLDVVLVSTFSFCGPPAGQDQAGAVYLGDGAGGFGREQSDFPPITGARGGLRLGDLDRDGRLDVLFSAGCGGNRLPFGPKVSFNETVQDQADLSVTVSGPGQRPQRGQASYTVTVTNNGELPTSSATTVRFAPAGAFRITATVPPTSGSGSSRIFTSGPIRPGDQVAYTVTGTIRGSSGSFSAVATVDGSRYDPALADNSAQTRTRIVG